MRMYMSTMLLPCSSPGEGREGPRCLLAREPREERPAIATATSLALAKARRAEPPRGNVWPAHKVTDGRPRGNVWPARKATDLRRMERMRDLESQDLQHVNGSGAITVQL